MGDVSLVDSAAVAKPLVCDDGIGGNFRVLWHMVDFGEFQSLGGGDFCCASAGLPGMSNACGFGLLEEGESCLEPTFEGAS